MVYSFVFNSSYINLYLILFLLIWFILVHLTLKMETSITCFGCKLKFLTIPGLTLHIRSCSICRQLNVFKCGEVDCFRQYSSLNSLSRHYYLAHNFTKSILNKPTSPVCDYFPSDTTQTVEVNQTHCSTSAYEEVRQFLSHDIALFISNLYNNKRVPRAVTQTVVSSLSDLVINSVAKVVEVKCQEFHSENCSSNSITRKFSSLFSESIVQFLTEYRRFKFFSNLGTFIAPEEIVIGSSMESQRTALGYSYLPVLRRMHVVLISQVLQKILQVAPVMDNIIENLNKFDMECNPQVIHNVVQGSVWRNAHKNAPHEPLHLPIIVFFDDFEVGNPLGSHAGVHKLGAVYISIPLLGNQYVSLLDCIFLVASFHSSDRLKFRNVLFGPVINQLNTLSNEGFEINTPAYVVRVKVHVAAITGDNLGLDSIHGFVESFSANYSCRICRANKQQMQTMCNQDDTLLRDETNYGEDLELNEVSQTGVKEKSCWSGLHNFSLFDHVAVDLLHDVLEGVCRYTMSYVIKYLIRDVKIISLEILNKKINSFDWGPDMRSKPVVLR